MSDLRRAEQSLNMRINNPMYNEAHRVKQKANCSRGPNNPRYGKPGTMLGKKLTVDQKAKCSYKIQTPEGIFPSSVEAAKHFGCSQQTVINRCKSDNFKEWQILEKGIKYTELEEGN